MRAAVVAGLGSWLPPRVVTNDELTAKLDTTDEWIRTRIGVATRHVVEPGMATSDPNRRLSTTRRISFRTALPS